jgi:hypothetical protein
VGDERVSGQGECPGCGFTFGCGHDGGVGVYACPSCRANAIEDALGEHYTGGGADALPDDVRALGVRHAWADGRRLRAEKDALALRAREERMRAVVEAAREYTRESRRCSAGGDGAFQRMASAGTSIREALDALDREDPPACAPDGEPMPTRSRRMIDAQRALAALTPDEERELFERGGWQDGVEDPPSTDPDPREMRALVDRMIEAGEVLASMAREQAPATNDEVQAWADACSDVLLALAADVGGEEVEHG